MNRIAMDLTSQLPLHIEVVQKNESRTNKENIKAIVHSYLSNIVALIPGESLTEKDFEKESELRAHVEAITVCDVDHDGAVEVRLDEVIVEPVYHVFRLDARGAETDTMTDAGTGEEFAAADVWPLPARDFHGLWESLVFDSRLKQETVRLIETAFEFAELGVDPHLVGWNRVVLLHGPPGTGKTSLCRALAHKLAVRCSERYPRARLLEINAHGLFSKWFAESGKLVARLFERVHETLADRRLLCVVLVDEVESLAHARRAALAGLEPSDSIRAVNALLTQLDRLRGHPNALVLATSNVTGAIDAAFADRADIKRRIGPPSARAAYEILRASCAELEARGALLADAQRLFPWRILACSDRTPFEGATASSALEAAAREAAGARLSARALRRLPLLARALLPRSPPPTLPALVSALHAALRRHLADADEFLDDVPAPAPSPPRASALTPAPSPSSHSLHSPTLLL